MEQYDVIVVGVGSMGSATLCDLAKKGLKVLGLEQFTLANEFSSHTGQSRLIRLAYFEHPNYVPLLKKAYAGWRQIEADAGVSLLHQTGIAYYGKSDGPLISGIQSSVVAHDLTMSSVPTDHYAPLRIPKDYKGLFEEVAGFVTPEKAIRTYAQQALILGAVLRQNERVISWQQHSNHIVVQTDQGSYHTDKLILTAGPHIQSLLPSFKPKLTITRQLIGWMNPSRWQDFSIDDFPCWVIEEEGIPGIYYGFPILPIEGFAGPIGLKIAYHAPGEVIDPQRVKAFDGSQEAHRLLAVSRRYFRDQEMTMLSINSCLYTYSSDDDFIIDYLPQTDEKVILATGFSGHGFKFVPAIGDVLSKMARGLGGEVDLTFLSMDRFGD